MARKLALASRGYEIENVFIDELYDEANKEGVHVEQWHEFLRAELPSPTQFDDTDDGAENDPSTGDVSGGDAAAAAAEGRARHKVERSSSKAGLLSLTFKTRAGSRAVLRRISMPFQELAPIVTAPALGTRWAASTQVLAHT
jgi:hypothetical protein